MTQDLEATLLTVGDIVRWGASRLNESGRHFGHGTDNAADESRVLVFHALALDFEAPAYFYQCRVTAAERAAAVALIESRIETGRPAAYLTGEAWFAGLRFEVDEAVLVPRSPIAELIGDGFSAWFGPQQIHRALDIGTGSGCIACALAAHLGCRVDATDISPAALEVARRNVRAHNLGELVELHESDVYSALGDRRYDLIVSNPPYVSAASMAALPDEYAHEPDLALRGGADGLDILERILAGAAAHLSTGGILICEAGEAAPSLAERYPGVAFEWIDFERGGDGVFAARAQDLERFATGARCA